MRKPPKASRLNPDGYSREEAKKQIGKQLVFHSEFLDPELNTGDRGKVIGIERSESQVLKHFEYVLVVECRDRHGNKYQDRLSKEHEAIFTRSFQVRGNVVKLSPAKAHRQGNGLGM